MTPLDDIITAYVDSSFIDGLVPLFAFMAAGVILAFMAFAIASIVFAVLQIVLPVRD